MTTVTIRTIGTSWAPSRPWSSRRMSHYPCASMRSSLSCGGRKMKRELKKKSLKRTVAVNVTTGTVEDFFRRSVQRARKLDRGEKLPAEMRLTFEDPADLVRVLSAQRIRVLLTVRSK